ncbi:MAG TPA: recombinase family protein [Schlesneria sp.]
MLKTNFDAKRPYRVVIYVRMSSTRQNPRSPDQQIATINEVIKRLGLPWIVVAIYRDDAISGTLTKRRPQFQKMLSDLRSGAVQADLIAVDTFARLTRSKDASHIRHKIERMGLLVVTANSSFADPTTIGGKAHGLIEEIQVNHENEEKAHNVVRGKKDAARAKQSVGGPSPFGTRLRNVMVTRGAVEEIDHRVVEPDPETKWIVVEAFRLADEHGMGTARIARRLNADPAIPAKSKPFHSATIGRILDNPIYYGELVWGKNCTGIVDDVRVVQPLPESDWIRVPDYCEPIVSREHWNRVQAIRNARRNRNRVAEACAPPTDRLLGLRAPGIALKYILTGLVRCAHCRRAMTPSSSAEYHAKDGTAKRYVAYACPGLPDGTCDNGRRIPEPWLRGIIMELVRVRLFFAD